MNKKLILKVKKLHEEAILPNMVYKNDSGFDVFSVENVNFFFSTVKKIKIGLAFELPPNTELQVRPKSGLASQGFACILGTVDEGYRGEVEIICHYFGNKDFKVSKGQKIAQLVLMPVLRPKIEVVENLNESERGIKGFGSTGA